MLRDLKWQFYWKSMKRDVGSFMFKCLTRQQVKIECQKPMRLLQPLPVLE